jgi:cytoskeletal protein CcmA (bactofilin family)
VLLSLKLERNYRTVLRTMASTGTLAIKGELSADEDVQIDGTFEGAIVLHGHDLVTGEASRVDAAVSARAVILRGQVNGQISADTVDIGRTARVQANVMTNQLAMADGAQFNGSVNTERALAAIEVARHRFAQRDAS